MNGRCETDPLDRAINVCGSCYGEFCESCLVMMKGRRHPVCTRCARVLSGVRPGHSIERRGPRNSAKKRREALQAAAADDDNTFAYFEPESLPADEQPQSSPSRLQRISSRRKKGKGEDGASETAEDEISSSPPRKRAKAKPPIAAVDQLAQLRAEQAEQSEPADKTPPDDQAATERPDEGPTSPEVAATPDPELAASEPAPTATSKANADASTVAGPAVVDLDDPKTEHGGREAETVEADGLVARLTGRGGDEEPGAAASEPLEPSAPSSVESEALPARPERNYPERRKGEHLKQQLGKPTTAPMIGEIQTIGGRRSTDAIQAETVLAPPSSLTADEPDDAAIDGGVELRGIDDFDAQQAGTTSVATIPAQQSDKGEQSDKAKHDVDANGNWVPPILRGMAEDAREAAGSLPRRRSAEGSP